MSFKKIKKKDQKNYMKNEYAKMWTQMRNKEYKFGYYDKFLLDLITKSLNTRKKKILDVGCGDGNPFAKKLISKYDYFGVDISDHLIAIAKKRYGERKFKVVDAEKLKIKKKFDLIICFHSLWYIPGYLKTIKKMTKILKPNGYLIFDSLNKNNPNNINHYRKIVYETKGLGKFFRLLKNLLKIFFKPGYTKWSDVIHHKLNDIQKINNIFCNKKSFKNINLFGLISGKKKFFKIKNINSKNLNIYSKIIFI